MQTSVPRVGRYQNSRLKEWAGKAAIPVFSVLHRPMFRRLAEMAYDFALRWNGFAIGFRGKHHLTHAEERFLERFLPTLPAGGLLFDVGANDGHYSAFMHRIRPDLPIHAFEPHPRTFASLRGSPATAGIVLHEMALSDVSGAMRLYDFADDDGSTQASLAAESVGLFTDRTVSHEVEVGTLDAFAAAHGIEAIAFLKIDTEGNDIKVLRGSRRLLDEGRIGAIQFEFIPANVALRVTMRDFHEVLAGYELHRLLVDGSLLPLGGYDVKRQEIPVIHNIIALRTRRPG